jgi:hypothetical protein
MNQLINFISLSCGKSHQIEMKEAKYCWCLGTRKQFSDTIIKRCLNIVPQSTEKRKNLRE